MPKPNAMSGSGKPGGSWSRREFLSTLAGSAAAVSSLEPLQLAFAREESGSVVHNPSRRRIAILATEVCKHSHPQHFIDRFLEGYGWQGRHYYPQVDLASIYVDQFPEND